MGPPKATGSLQNGRGQLLHTVEFLPPGPPRARLVFHHGYGEHTGRYDAVFAQLAEAGVVLYAYDCHGHGRSEPTGEADRGLIWDFSDVVDDLARFVAHVRARSDDALPLFLGGQSMGNLAALHLVLRDPRPFRGLVLGTATIDIKWTLFLRLQAAVGGLLAALVPRARIVPAVRGEDMDPDPAVVGQLVGDPLNQLEQMRARTAHEILRAFGVVAAREHELALPLYAHHGTADRLADIDAVKRLLRNSASTDVTMYEVEGGYHELFMGAQKVEVTQRIIQWVLAHCEADREPR